MTKWWKCDLQVATPAWNFAIPPDTNYNLETEEGRAQFADRYMDELRVRGVEVISIADHNTGDWVDTMVTAGVRKGIHVFPGCEVTTGTGADGIHILVIGDRSKTSREFDRLLAGPIGYDDEHPRFHTQGDRQVPGSSGKTLTQILDALSDEYLVVAPHVLNANGLVSNQTAKGDIRWRALHHDRLGAIDPGDCNAATEQSFNDKFRRRELNDFPRLKEIAFVSTSDAYEFAHLGRRFCWIRMEDPPSLEGLRQAFLDAEARIICSWDPRLNSFPESNPNRIRHSWVERVELNGRLANSSSPLTVTLHPALNVLIGGRGSGKSTVVAAFRQLYSGTATLPQMVRQEAEFFARRVFAEAELSSTFRNANSQEAQTVRWTSQSGSLAQPPSGPLVPTTFRVRVVNQKELFERVSHDQSDPLSASRSFLAFVDESLGFLKDDPPQPGSWWRRYEDASARWMTAAREHQKLKVDLTQLPTIRATIRNLEAQIAAFDSPDAKARRERNELRFQQREALRQKEATLRALIEDLRGMGGTRVFQALDLPLAADGVQEFLAQLAAIENQLREKIMEAASSSAEELDRWRSTITASHLQQQISDAEADDRAYLQELVASGIDPNAYAQLKATLAREQNVERNLAEKEQRLATLLHTADTAWTDLRAILQERRSARAQLFAAVSERSGRLRFELRSNRDVIGWKNAVRELLNLRADAYLEDVPALAEWLWGAPDDATREHRWLTWRAALTTGVFTTLAGREQASLRGAWLRRLESLDEAIRLRLTTEVADDIVQIAFLRDGGRPDRAEDWQDITQGSPGQRTAAMLGFVLHHGDEPLVLDQPEDDLDTEWISNLVVRELRASRCKRQVIAVTHNANIPVNGDAERIVVLENKSGALQIRRSTITTPSGDLPVQHCGAIELQQVREDVQNIMEGGIRAFIQRERKYNNEVRSNTGR